jgi:Tol biopolymer transport system component/DNA-binding winged helix-turn-helix (wHTH) protein
MRDGAAGGGEDAARPRAVYQFGDIRVDLARMAARRDDAPIALEPKAFDVLVYLIRHRDRVVTKEEILDAVWTGTFVTPNVLTRAVAQIRKALGDDSDHGRFIETLAKRGYRFVAPVTVVGGAPDAAVEPGRVAPADPLPVTTDAAPPPLRRRWGAAALALVLAAAAAAATVVLLKVRNPGARTDAADLQLKRLTNRRGYSGMPTLSPDGRAIVYSAGVAGGLELYLASLLPGGAELPLTKDGGHNVQPAWSPDGQWIAYHSRSRGGIWIVPATGGAPQQVAEFGSDPAWAPGSDRLVFTSESGAAAGSSTLWIARRDGSERRALTTAGQPAGSHRMPAWSHDGRHVVFVVGFVRRADVRAVDVATGEQQLIGTATNALDPAFAPDDRAILWGVTTLTGKGRLFRQTIEGNAKPLGAAHEVLPIESGSMEGLSIAANGTVAFGVRTQDANVWRIELDASGRGGEPARLTDGLSRTTRAEYSQDGRVAYMQTAVGSPPSVWMMDEDGANKVALIPGTGVGNPEWDASGKRLLLTEYREESAAGFELVWLDLASRRLTSSGLDVKGMTNPRLSPDATRLAFHQRGADGHLDVWTTTFDGVRTRIAGDPEALSYPAWSRDGKWLAVEMQRGDSMQIGVVPSSGGAVEQLTSQRGQSWPHSWSPDNDRIAFAGDRGGVWNLYTVSRRTRSVVQVTSFTSAAGYVRYPSWSPSGTHIMFERAIDNASLWTMTLPPER